MKRDLVSDRIGKALVSLGDVIKTYLADPVKPEGEMAQWLSEAVARAQENPWFTRAAIHYCLSGWQQALMPSRINRWLKMYPELITRRDLPSANILVVMAGNIPMVGFHDLVCCLMAGHRVIAKLSSEDLHLIPAALRIMASAEPSLESGVEFTTGQVSGFDGVIATGSDNTSRYFEYYFGKYPHLIRKNRNSLAVVTGNESFTELDDLCDDIFTYFGMGCRSVSKILVPEGYDFNGLISLFDARTDAAFHHKYRNNYDYRKSIFLLNGIPFIDHPNLLLVEDQALASPLAVLHYQYYRSRNEMEAIIRSHVPQLQTVVADQVIVGMEVPYGKSQQPDLWDYADRTDTLRFLLDLKGSLPQTE
ncbi:MAG TPA: acyl-CoA reductase [Bacteroidales bacterium]|nr:acyl-CoA reductase [Bacteroidales bacterium]HRZ49941.1 acyl-CoA reductase [Bacteroidales bacterium]